MRSQHRLTVYTAFPQQIFFFPRFLGLKQKKKKSRGNVHCIWGRHLGTQTSSD